MGFHLLNLYLQLTVGHYLMVNLHLISSVASSGVFFLSGPECSVPLPANSSFWNQEDYPEGGLARASHKAVVEQGLMWVIGGYVFNASDYHMVKA